MIQPPGRAPGLGGKVRFGPFELDVRAGELRKHGVKLRLQDQPLQILLLLLEHPGQPVAREEIRLRLWPNGTIVEFDHGINAAVQRLRDVLRDSADGPHYIETVGRRGYRFLAEVERIGAPQPEPKPESQLAPSAVDTREAGDLTGKVLSHYRILDKLGEGGMGVVYRAEDLKLGRHVALKFLPCGAAELPELVLRRFEREARAASALNHPHICTIHGLEDFAGQPGIVMELVEGETLAAQLHKGPLPLDQSLSLATQIAGALAEAHRRGVVHRDLKPSNIMLTGSGAKVLDFGLATMERGVALSAEAATVTQNGAILGTLHYMSPEQVEGKEADARSDIFSFGLVLYEMITGKRAFDGDSAASVMAGILEREAPAIEPEGLNRVMRTCLAKNPDERFQNAHDLKRAIEWINSGSGAAPIVPRTSRKWIPWAVAGSFAALAFLIWLRMGPMAAMPPKLVLTIVPPPGTKLSLVGSAWSIQEVSPDGSSVLYSATGGPWVRRLDSLEPKLLRAPGYASGAAFWSADSRAIVYPADHDLIRVRVPDGTPEVIANLPSYTRGGTQGDNQQILISCGDRLYAVPATQRELKLVDVPGLKAGRHEYPQFLAGSEDFLFLLVPHEAEGGEVYLATLHHGKAVNPILLMKNDTAVSYTPVGGGRIWFVRNDNLYSQKLDRSSRKLEGDADLIQQGVASSPGGEVDHAAFSVSRSGAVAWRPGRAALSQVTIFDRLGNEIGKAGPLLSVDSVALSPDETHLVATGEGSWLLSPGQPGGLNLGKGRWGTWSPDGSRLLRRTGSGRMEERFVNGSNEVREVGDAKGWPQDVSPDGKQVLTMLMNEGIFATRLEGAAQERAPQAIVHTGEAVWGPGISPDGRWVVYSVRGGKSHGIYVQPFPGPGMRKQVATTNGFPVWRKDGKEIIVFNWGDVWSVPVDVAGSGLSFSTPKLLFSGLRSPAGGTLASRLLAVSRDGSRFYFPQAVAQPDTGVIHVRMGWDNK